ncbi:GDP-mannose mannosyl hydrolase [Shewanella algae]|uniref:GDP-mannose mannosyl hydrolase n=1 Tax=Shewanella algae TaxID=38313 RepID=UPI0031F4E358
MFLERDIFSKVIESAPLVSIDLVVTDSKGMVLLGERLNRPAKGCWFVPGGRVLKNEPMREAFKRLTRDELGLEYSIDRASLLGIFDHFYDDYVFGNEITTHYVAIAFVIQLDVQIENLPINKQHCSYQWFSVPCLLADKKVHVHTKWYFDSYGNKDFIKEKG